MHTCIHTHSAVYSTKLTKIKRRDEIALQVSQIESAPPKLISHTSTSTSYVHCRRVDELKKFYTMRIPSTLSIMDARNTCHVSVKELRKRDAEYHPSFFYTNHFSFNEYQQKIGKNTKLISTV